MDSSGNETVLFPFDGFNGPQDTGYYPGGNLATDGQHLYGVTEAGGATGDGVIFELNKSGNETILYSFQGTTDGDLPTGVIRDSSGNLYGTNMEGGYSGCVGSRGCGTVFKLDPSNHLNVLHSFSGSDGFAPAAALLLDKAGNLYGTTEYGGKGNCILSGQVAGCGVVFKIAP